MKQVVQNIKTGETSVLEVPAPVVLPGHIVIANAASVISAGTEKMLKELASKSLLGKALARPDHVRRTLEKLRNEGFLNTLNAVKAKLDEPMSLGYASAGVVLACGAGVHGFAVGDRVASNGPHAGVVCVPKHLCAKMPGAVSFEQGAFTVLGAIALQGVRLSKTGLGDTVLVVGLGLIGQLAVALLAAQGCRVFGTDPDPERCKLAERMGAHTAKPGLGDTEVAGLTGQLGADAVLVTASTPSDEPVRLAANAVRKKGRIVVVGAVGLNLQRPPLYIKEAELVVSCSYGPGRYDPAYEDRGRDYPAAYVRWTEQRNMQAVLDLMAGGRLDVAPLISHRYEIEKALEAYALIEGGGQAHLGIVLTYPDAARGEPARTVTLKAPAKTGALSVGMLGAGSHARAVLLPALDQAKVRKRIVCAAGGLSAAHHGAGFGFEKATSDEQEVLNDSETQAVLIATTHDQHARQAAAALRAGKHVFLEKPLGLTIEDVQSVEQALAQQAERCPLLCVNFNRRFSPSAKAARDFFAQVSEPLTLTMRFNAGAVPAEHWAQDDNIGGGRIVGEACHGIDLVTYLTGSVPVRVFAEAAVGATGNATDDRCVITLRHRNGSVSSICYTSGGDKAFPKERVEIFGGGRVAVIDDFREVVTSLGGKRKRSKGWQQDKGHAAALQAFLQALETGGPPPMTWEEIRAVSLASILAVQSLREGLPFEIP